MKDEGRWIISNKDFGKRSQTVHVTCEVEKIVNSDSKEDRWEQGQLQFNVQQFKERIEILLPVYEHFYRRNIDEYCTGRWIFMDHDLILLTEKLHGKITRNR